MPNHLAAVPERVWFPVVAPSIWAVHFMVCYVTVALQCGRFARVLSPAHVTWVIAACTVVAMAAMLGCLIDGVRRHGYRLPARTHDADTPQDRRHFLAFTTVLLAGLSLIATAYAALALLFVRTCA